MIKNYVEKGSSILAGIAIGISLVGFAGLVAANSSFSGPAKEPPNGFVSPVFDGLTVNGDVDFNPSQGDNVTMENVYIDDLQTNRIEGCIGCPDANVYGNGSQYLKISTVTLDVGGDDIRIGTGTANTKISMPGHLRVDSIGATFERNGEKSLGDYSTGTLQYSYTACPTGTHLLGCSSYLTGDSDNSYRYEGTRMYHALNMCYGYVRQNRDDAMSATLKVQANCWDLDNINTNL